MKLNYPNSRRKSNGWIWAVIGFGIFALLLLGIAVFALGRYPGVPVPFREGSAPVETAGSSGGSKVKLGRSSDGADWVAASADEKGRFCRQVATVVGDVSKAGRVEEILDEYFQTHPHSEKLSDAMLEIYTARK